MSDPIRIPVDYPNHITITPDLARQIVAMALADVCHPLNDRVLRECHNCGADIQPGEWRKAITGKYRDEIGTRYYCAKCEGRLSTGDPACLPNTVITSQPDNQELGGERDNKESQ